MEKNLPYLFLFFLCLLASCKNQDSEEDGLPEEPYRLVWSDEFDLEGGPDPTKWKHEKGLIRNQEDQYYTDSLKNAYVMGGNLILKSIYEEIANEAYVSKEAEDWRENREFAEYTSASLTTRGLEQWTYGKIDVRAKLPKGVGVWPAIWMLGDNISEVDWPKCGELDIMEHVGYNKDSIFGSVHTETYNHTKGTAKGKAVFIANPYDEFHIYSLEWTREKINFLLDGKVYHYFNNEHRTINEWPFDQPFYLKLNLAIGGTWGGQNGVDLTIFPQQMTVDYVRVYEFTQ
ncbi:glycoside hydrolase family 16 protein [Arenibacter echinorum]|uniref:glycoside hydrolase family 16 protein n=1 Tax=Arenibacter echinorum TaxID=440515 RepID=UPI000DBA7839|nr:glycoside hydrolase family 16 protein [Arenibacter echinorum]